jgi:23S rRNA (cytosine1962-C5)-methyltransferase
MIKLTLKKSREVALQRKHPWVFSGALHPSKVEPIDGEIAYLYTEKGEFLAWGHYHRGSIALRILSFEQGEPTLDFYLEKFRNALSVRGELSIFHGDNHKETNCFRLCHAEGDGLPGLIIDIYGSVAVVQCHSIGMHRNIDVISEALKLLDWNGKKIISGIYLKSKESLPFTYSSEMEDSWIWGEDNDAYVLENGNKFKIDWVRGQKTGFFLDQRENRSLLGSFSKNKKVLNAFGYSGGFSIYALKNGASSVVTVDVSTKAIELANENVELNFPNCQNHEGVVDDVQNYLKSCDLFDIVIIDPPAYAKTLEKRHNAVQGYKRLNISAMKKVKPGGLLFTFSCSQVVSKELFDHTIASAAIEVGRPMRILAHLSQPSDHPVNIFHPEGNYLKGLVIWVG